MIKQLKCRDGILTLYEDRVTIEPKGIGKLNKGFFKGKKEILIDSISAVQFRPGGSMINGYLQFTLAGGNESTKGILDVTKDENSIIITKKQNKDAEFIKEIRIIIITKNRRLDCLRCIFSFNPESTGERPSRIILYSSFRQM